MDWLDAHAGSVQAVATFVLVALTGYYAWASRALVRETRASLQASARATLQARLDRISEILINRPELFASLNEPATDAIDSDARFQIAGMFLAVLEEAHTQFTAERLITRDDWGAWQATADALLQRRYLSAYWQQVGHTFEPSFQRFVETRLREVGREPNALTR